ncbi:MAG: nucleoside hydrolase-like domain-containing protein [Asticcacaulis sp.]|uniref:DUF1593 domain-containing protein n=1 Tax=Asticcacaulis sp. TaxID=1872648 RepID=UPI003F7B5567
MPHKILSPSILLACGLCLAPLQTMAAQPAAAHPPLSAPTKKQRLIVLTDIGGEPDDTESMVRLMLYSSEIDIEGLVATTSVWMKNDTHPDDIRHVIEAYGKARPNLLLNETGYPTVESLLAKVAVGQPGYGMDAVGNGKDSAGSNLIVKALESNDPRPLWVTAWGGINTLAQALETIHDTKSPVEAKRLIAKLRVYAISDQDDAGPWLRKKFPDLFYIVSVGAYANATWTGNNAVIDGIDNDRISNGWLAKNIQQGHGALGAAYPDVGWGMEGDTPSFLALIPNGLSVPDHPDYGGWGGRYILATPSVEGLGDSVNGGIPIMPETRPIWSNAIDAYTPYVPSDYGRAIKPGDKTFKDFRVTLWRWRDDYQNDFAARMQWATKPFAQTNHAPIIKLATPDHMTVHSGDYVGMSAAGTTDPDGDSLSYLWFDYAEAGSLDKPIAISGAEDVYHAGFTAPVVTKPETVHIILKVTDKGMPSLTSYKRIIVTVLP